MTDTFQFAALAPVLPEIALAVGAMVLLMFGAVMKERSLNFVTVMSILLLLGVHHAGRQGRHEWQLYLR